MCFCDACYIVKYFSFAYKIITPVIFLHMVLFYILYYYLLVVIMNPVCCNNEGVNPCLIMCVIFTYKKPASPVGYDNYSLEQFTPEYC